MIKLRRGVIGKDTGLDVSSRSASITGNILAPTVEMVIALRKGNGIEGWPKINTITKEEYINMYYNKLEQVDQWFWNIIHRIGSKEGEITFLCHCNLNKETCHVEFLINYMINKYPNIYRREIQSIQEVEPEIIQSEELSKV